MASTWPAKNNYATGDVLTATNMNGIGDDLNDVYTTAGSAAGKNKLINGNFDYWQRGTSLALTGNNASQYLADRWICTHNGSTAGTVTASRQAFTVGQTDVPNNPNYFVRITNTTLGTGQTQSEFYQFIEDVATFAGQTTTISFYAKASGSFPLVVYAYQNFGSGGSGSVFTAVTMSSSTLTANWVKYTGTIAVPSISGKTVGAGNFLGLIVRQSSPTNGSTFDLAQAQWELGSIATPFSRAGGTLQGELAACQRYYQRFNASGAYSYWGGGTYYNSTTGTINIAMPVQMRTAPTSVDYSNLSVTTDALGGNAAATPSINSAYQSTNYFVPTVSVASGGVQAKFIYLSANNSTSAYIGWSAEL